MTAWAARVVGCLLLGLAACSVDQSSLGADVFPCHVASDCGDGWGCVSAGPYAADFCAPKPATCDTMSCDGLCTGDGYCLRRCDLTDGTCQGPGWQCIRTSTESMNGICYPVQVCATAADCPSGSGDLCLSEIARAVITGDIPLDHLYCVPGPDASGMCPMMTPEISIPLDATMPTNLTSFCLPTCSITDTHCPPAFGCLTQSALGGGTPPCFPGLWGIPCTDDTNCLTGTCQCTAPSGDCTGAPSLKVCTISCNEAQTRYGTPGCSALTIDTEGGLSFYAMECDHMAAGGTGGGLCAPRYTIGWPDCTIGANTPYQCVSQTDTTPPVAVSCDALTDRDGTTVHVCTHDCTTTADCNRTTSMRNFCYHPPAATTGFCLERSPRGAACLTTEWCQAGLTCNAAMLCE